MHRKFVQSSAQGTGTRRRGLHLYTVIFQPLRRTTSVIDSLRELAPGHRRAGQFSQLPHDLRIRQQTHIAVVRSGMIHRAVFPTDQGRGAEPGDFRELGLRHPVALPDPSNPQRREDAEMVADRLQLDLLGLPIKEFQATFPTSTHREIHGKSTADSPAHSGRCDDARSCPPSLPHTAGQDRVGWSTAVETPVGPVSITIIALTSVPTRESCAR